VNKKIKFYDVKLHHVAPGDTKVRFDFLVGINNFLNGLKDMDEFRLFCHNFNSEDIVNTNITIEVIDEQK
jgi:hypothetical protein